jgi:hypothetical protein
MTVEGPSKDTPPSNSNRELYVTCGVTVRRYLPKILRRDVRDGTKRATEAAGLSNQAVRERGALGRRGTDNGPWTKRQ